MVSETMKTCMVCIDSYEQKLFCGRAYFEHFEEKKQFSNLMQLLLIIDGSINAIGFPEPYSSYKGFVKVSKGSDRKIWRPADGEFVDDSGQLATFAIKVLFQQNASWQGIISWMEGRKEESFRSTYELIMLMDNALESGKTAKS